MRLPLALALLAALPRLAPAQRLELDLNAGWSFRRGDQPSWESVRLPHTWNARDGQDGPTPGQTARPNERGSDYFRGSGEYRRQLDIPAQWAGRRIFVAFEAASQTAAVTVNGAPAGSHRGGFTAFCLEVTRLVRPGGANTLDALVDNTLVPTLPPLAGDFNVDGGLYRPAHLLVTDPVCISPLDSGSPGLFGAVTDLRSDWAVVAAEAELSNSLSADTDVTVRFTVRDATGRIVASVLEPARAAAGAVAQPVRTRLSVPSPRLWRGLADPYLYSLRAEVLRDGRAVDAVTQSLGIRQVALTDSGFSLNGKPYPVLGISRHQDRKDQGWALSDADEAGDLDLIRDLGATALRLAHYPQSESWHRRCDSAGLLLWEEIPFVNEVPSPGEDPAKPSPTTIAFQTTLESELREMIRQRFNHPSVAWWGLFNELRPGAMCRAAFPEVVRLNRQAGALDPHRITVCATDHFGNPTNTVTATTAYNWYPGWYVGSGEPGELARLIDEAFTEQHGRQVAISEYGAGGNPWQHAEEPVAFPGANGAPFHPEEWQSLMHERDWAQIAGNPKVWGSFVWTMFDFASDGRAEGGTRGINDKGIVTQDRALRKDAYYFYRANWSDRPTLYIAARRASIRHQPVTPIKIYSNQPLVELRVNGRSMGARAPNALHIARWEAVPLVGGRNRIEAAAGAWRDACEWNLIDDRAAPALAKGNPLSHP